MVCTKPTFDDGKGAAQTGATIRVNRRTATIAASDGRTRRVDFQLLRHVVDVRATDVKRALGRRILMSCIGFTSFSVRFVAVRVRGHYRWPRPCRVADWNLGLGARSA